MRYWPLSINFYLYNLMADERQRGSHEIVQSPGDIFCDVYHVFMHFFVIFITFSKDTFKKRLRNEQPFDNLRDMQRDVYQRLLEWKQRPKRKPLLVKGARQVGKTFIRPLA